MESIIMVALNTLNHVDKELLKTYCGGVLQYEKLIDRLKQFWLEHHPPIPEEIGFP